FGGLLVALAGAVEFPAVIDAAYVVTLDPAEMHLRAAMRATIVDDLRGAALAAIDREILAHDADRPGLAGRQVLGAHHRHPEPTHETAHRCARAGAGEVEIGPVLAGGLEVDDAHPLSPYSAACGSA